MRKTRLLRLFVLVVFCYFSCVSVAFAQKTFGINGVIRDKSTRETLIGASVLIKELKSGTTADVNGKYKLALPAGTYTLQFSYMGYQTFEKIVDLKGNINLNVDLLPTGTELNAVEIHGVGANRAVTRNEMGAVKMSIETIKTIPVLMGEVDIIKSIQMLPGVMATSEGGSGFSVRGGAPDQNLIIIDGATVYNASHALGFFSVFNNDAIDDVTLYKGDIPIQYGGRLASVLDITMKEGSKQDYSVSGGIGLLSSRLEVDGPIWKDHTSFLVAARRTYFDLFLPLAKNEMAKNVKLYFWDINAKISHDFNKNNKLTLSFYDGLDVFGVKDPYAEFDYGNIVGSLAWKHLFNDELSLTTTAMMTKYDYSAGMAMGSVDALMKAFLDDYTLKFDFTWIANAKNTIRFGASSTWHTYGPGDAYLTVNDTNGYIGNETQTFSMPDNHALENAIYIGNDQEITKRFSLKYGLRFSTFSNVGPDSVYYYDANWNLMETKYYKKGDFYHTYTALEPRIGAVFLLDSTSSIKANYSRTSQYTQLAQSSSGGNPMDLWYPANPNIKPQTADMYAIGYFKNFADNMFETSIETYYKQMHNCIDLKDFSNTIMNPQLYGELRVGEGQAYGVEFFIKKAKGKFNGWISYTLSRTERKIPEINNGKTYLAPYDKTHTVNIVLSYNLNKRQTISANWVYYTGNAVTFPTGRAEVGNIILPVYSDRNDCRMPNYHRLDLSYTIKSKEVPGRRWSYDWNFSIYNAYARHNPWSISFKQDKDNPSQTYAEMIYLFSIVPSVTFNFKF